MRIIRGLLTLLLLVTAGCQATPSVVDQSNRQSAASPVQSATSVVNRTGPAGGSAGPIAVYIAGEPVTWATLRDPLVELGGSEVLTEQILSRMIDRRLAQRAIALSDAALEAEADLMRQALSSDSTRAHHMLAELRRRKGLGQVRWQLLLRRNAGMRALVQPEVTVTDDALRQAYDIRYGPRYEVRLIVVDSASQASQVLREARAGATFSDLAIANSTDSSRAQGGLLNPISANDPTWPLAIRQSLPSLAVGEISSPIALDQGFGILKLEGKTEGQSIPIDDVKDKLAEQVRLDVESMLMRRLARTLLDEADVVILDSTLKHRYEEQKQP